VYSKTSILIIAAFLLAAALPQAYAQAESWSFSPYLAQVADEDAGQTPENEGAAVQVDDGKKNIGRGVMFSLVIPGAGQLYSGSWLRAVPWFAIEVAGWVMFSKYNADGDNKTKEFEKFAGPHQNTDPSQGNFNYNAYMLREYQIALNPTINETGTAYGGPGLDFSTWKDEPWDVRASYLPPPFGHDVRTGDIQQYYEMIGKYYTQFGYGWIDTYDRTVYSGTFTGDEPNTIWAFSGDDPSTLWFDGSSPLFFQYRDMRGEANDLLEKSNMAMEIVLANHVLSALDAAFAIRSHNKRLSESPLGQMNLKYDPKVIDGQYARMLTLSFPLDRK
jgi:hypothetical protein